MAMPATMMMALVLGVAHDEKDNDDSDDELMMMMIALRNVVIDCGNANGDNHDESNAGDDDVGADM
eukprot:9009724-Pyramimonas_sp.AAC.1